MSEEVTDQLDVFMSKVNTAVDLISEKLVDVAPDALDAILTLVWSKGIYGIVSGLIILALSYVCGSIGLKLYKRADELNKTPEYKYATPIEYIHAFFFWFVSFVLLVVSFAKLIGYTTWLSVFYPEGVLALKALSAAGIYL